MDAFSLITHKEIKTENYLSNNHSNDSKLLVHFQEIKQEAEVSYVCELPEVEVRCIQNASELLSDNESAKQLVEKRTKAKCAANPSKRANFECGSCKKSYASRQGLSYHFKVAHIPRPRIVFKCAVCSRKFNQQNHLKSHLITHRKNATYSCDICGRHQKLKSHMKRHVVVHRTDHQYQCDLCPKVFKTKKYLQRHVVTHFPPKRIQCELCSTQMYPSNMRFHLMTHFGKPFTCDLCPATFVQKNKLAYHRRTHTGEKPHKCKVCGKSFTYNQALKDHTKIKHENLLLICKICPKIYTSKQGLRSHINKHHLKFKN